MKDAIEEGQIKEVIAGCETAPEERSQEVNLQVSYMKAQLLQETERLKLNTEGDKKEEEQILFKDSLNDMSDMGQQVSQQQQEFGQVGGGSLRP